MFSRTSIAFTREAAIAGQLIGVGLTSLRSANYAATGLYSHAFFSLSIGFERLMKLIFLIDYAIENEGRYPTDETLRKKFGHDLEKLFKFSELVHEKLPNASERFPIPPGGLEQEIISFLAQFAIKTRYYNLDFLISSKASSYSKDPIAEWFDVIVKEILSRHYSQSKRKKDAHQAEVIENIVGNISFVRHTAEDGSPITSMLEGALQTGRNKVIQKYGTFYCAKLSRFLYMILYDLNHLAHSSGIAIPYLGNYHLDIVSATCCYAPIRSQADVQSVQPDLPRRSQGPRVA